ncbi:Uncharacterised protein [Dermatophilus congolensis]|uniref:Uncharacterized protein n=1 Tax=Dermatophilus congolensis TaxID=1863 RepID=A0AA46BMQ6_9MICO|nr:Uncharacterised protein [Dermatophilus congolensis]
MVFAGELEGVDGVAFDAQNQDGSVFSLGCVFFEGNPGPDDFAGVWATIAVGGVGDVLWCAAVGGGCAVAGWGCGVGGASAGVGTVVVCCVFFSGVVFSVRRWSSSPANRRRKRSSSRPRRWKLNDTPEA